MKVVVMAVSVFVVSSLLLTPLLLLACQLGSHGSLHWNLVHMTAEHLVAASDKAMLLAGAITAVALLRPKMGRPRH